MRVAHAGLRSEDVPFAFRSPILADGRYQRFRKTTFRDHP